MKMSEDFQHSDAKLDPLDEFSSGERLPTAVDVSLTQLRERVDSALALAFGPLAHETV